jgi:aspartyl/asparaginyl beta-hydroxylase (cupin superfamily)
LEDSSLSESALSVGVASFKLKHARRFILFAVFAAAAAYFAPLIGLAFLLCGVLDVFRHKARSLELIDRYFLGNGVLTWVISPINLLADLFSPHNPGVYRLENMPAEQRGEIETCTRAFVANRDRIKEHLSGVSAQSRRTMLTFKWFGTPQQIDLRIPEFERDFRHIKTIAISVLNTRERTSRHFGPLRLTFRVLYNLEPVDSRDVFIEVDGVTHYWNENPLFIFDDTFFHRSINDVDQIRYCLFMDIVRPNYFHAAFDVAVKIASLMMSAFKSIFYKKWSFVR